MKIRKAPLPSNRKSHTVYLVRRHGRMLGLAMACDYYTAIKLYGGDGAAARRGNAGAVGTAIQYDSGFAVTKVGAGQLAA